MTYNVFSGTLNPTQSISQVMQRSKAIQPLPNDAICFDSLLTFRRLLKRVFLNFNNPTGMLLCLLLSLI